MNTRAPQASHRYVGSNLDNLADGRQLEPGQFVKLTKAELENPENQRLLDEGLLIETVTAKEDK